MNDDNRHTIDDLEQMTGVSRRTIRYYVQSGLLPPADGPGRGRHYGEHHMAGLARIQEAKRLGTSLAGMKNDRQGNEGNPSQPSEPGGTNAGPATRFLLAKEGVWLEVADGAAVPTTLQLARISEFCRNELGLGVAKGERSRWTVRSRTGGLVVVPDGVTGGTSLLVPADQIVEIAEVTPSIRRAEAHGLIEIVQS